MLNIIIRCKNKLKMIVFSQKWHVSVKKRPKKDNFFLTNQISLSDSTQFGTQIPKSMLNFLNNFFNGIICLSFIISRWFLSFAAVLLYKWAKKHFKSLTRVALNHCKTHFSKSPLLAPCRSKCKLIQIIQNTEFKYKMHEHTINT